MEPTIIEVALSGPPEPGADLSAAGLSAEILACLDAGASVIHNHLPDFRVTGAAAVIAYAEIWEPVLRARPDTILYPTLTAPAPGDPLGRYGHAVACVTQAGASLGPFDPGCVNFTAGRADGQPDPERSFAYVNDYTTLDRVLTAYEGAGIASSISIFDPSFLRAAMAYERAGRFVPGSLMKLYFGGAGAFLGGGPGVSFGLPATIAALDLYLDMMAGSSIPWAATLSGGDLLTEEAFVAAVLARGGHLRVGREDYAGTDKPSNVELVSRAADAARRCGRPPATSAETSRILGLS